MKTLCVLQHVGAEYLGLMEDHLESRAIRFRYVRPFVPGGKVPGSPGEFAGLVVLGAGPLGIVSGSLVPSIAAELRLVRAFLDCRLPVVGIGFGACLLATASGGGAAEAPLRGSLETAVRVHARALAGHLPERYPVVVGMRDRPVLPHGATVLAKTLTGAPALFQVAHNSLGFLGHPGIKAGMIEDLVMEFGDSMSAIAAVLAQLREAQDQISASLSEIMVGLTKLTHWLDLA
jgi:GMP synthase-like glutamine amidotransferase